MAGTNFSDYLGLKHYKKAQKTKTFQPFEEKMMVKIGVILIPFSNPTCHFKDTADFTRLKTVSLQNYQNNNRTIKRWNNGPKVPLYLSDCRIFCQCLEYLENITLVISISVYLSAID